MKKHGKKMIAPIIIIICVTLYFIIIGSVLLRIGDVPLPAKIAGFVIPVALAGVGVFVLVERIKEIRSGEEDDLGKY